MTVAMAKAEPDCFLAFRAMARVDDLWWTGDLVADRAALTSTGLPEGHAALLTAVRLVDESDGKSRQIPSTS